MFEMVKMWAACLDSRVFKPVLAGEHMAPGFFSKYVMRSYNIQTALHCLNEYTAVLVQLVCYSRLGQVDLFNGALLLYMVLIVFAFPFLNSYLFGFLRFGMWWVYSPQKGGKPPKIIDDEKEPDDAEEKIEMGQLGWFVCTMFQFVSITAFQVAGAYSASRVTKWSEATWNASYVSVSDDKALPVQFFYSGPSKVDIWWVFLEEFFAVFFLLIGLLHLIHCYSSGLLKNAFWKEKPLLDDNSDAGLSAGFESGTRRIEESLQDLSGKVDGLVNHKHTGENGDAADPDLSTPRTVRRSDSVNGNSKRNLIQRTDSNKSVTKDSSGTSVDLDVGEVVNPSNVFLATRYPSNLDTSTFFLRSAVRLVSDEPEASRAFPALKPSTEYFPVPSELIMHASLLVAAISRAFPSAHQSLHLSIYLWFIDLSGTDFLPTGIRILGGYAACGVALIYYWFWYVWTGHSKGDDSEWIYKSPIRKYWKDKKSALFRTELRLPNYTRLRV